MKSLKQMLLDKDQYDPASHRASVGTQNKFISREYQDYGYRLAMELGDEKHKALYIKLAKTMERAILEKCRTFVLDSTAESKGALFMWKLNQVKKATVYHEAKPRDTEPKV